MLNKNEVPENINSIIINILKAPAFLPRVICNDGTSLSIQANMVCYCTPQNNTGPYTHVEVGFIENPKIIGCLPKEWEEYNADYSIYGFVPIELVIKFIENHGGIKSFGPFPKYNIPREEFH